MTPSPEQGGPRGDGPKSAEESAELVLERSVETLGRLPSDKSREFVLREAMEFSKYYGECTQLKAMRGPVKNPSGLEIQLGHSRVLLERSVGRLQKAWVLARVFEEVQDGADSGDLSEALRGAVEDLGVEHPENAEWLEELTDSLFRD